MSRQHNNPSNSFEDWLAQQGQSDHIEQEVPEWDREHAFRQHYRPQSGVNRLTQPLAFAAFALSCVAVSLVVTQSYKADVDAQVAQQVDSLVEEKMALFKEQQKIRLAQHNKDLRNDFREQLSTSTTQLATYILATNRQERKDDMTQLVEYVNDTREEDQTFFAQQLRHVSGQPINPLLEE